MDRSQGISQENQPTAPAVAEAPSMRLARVREAQPLVTVIVPVYNAGENLRHCLDSIAHQTHENLQIVVVDDGATDGSGALCDEYAAADPRFEVIHQENAGIAAAQNAGLDAARGQFIAFCDDDDILAATNIEKLLTVLVSTDAGMSKGRWITIGESGVDDAIEEASQVDRDADGRLKFGTITLIDDPLKAYQTVFSKALRMVGGNAREARYFNEANWCRLYRAELWSNLRFPTGMYAQDVMVAGPLYTRMEMAADLDEPLYYWLQSAESVTHSKRDFGFYHDNVLAGKTNFEWALRHSVTPCRSYYTLTGSVREEGAALRREPCETPEEQAIHDQHAHEYSRDLANMHWFIDRLSIAQRMECRTLAKMRLAEKVVYDRKIKQMK